jgi:hypothetical protein
MKGQNKPCWTPFPISTIIVSRTGVRTTDIGSWLRSLGFEQYQALFRENDIDAEVLGDLTDADLEKLGVTLGHRKRLFKAIASLVAAEPAANPTSPASQPSSADSAERRPITVMFCDLAGSTSLAAKLDAEDWRNLVNAYLDEASAAVTGLGGHVLKKLGDGLMAPFHPPSLVSACKRQRDPLWWRLPVPPNRNSTFADIVEDGPGGVRWHTQAETDWLTGIMTTVHLDRN